MEKIETEEVTGIECPKCKEFLWSTHRHDFHNCSCGYCFVDGGRDYLRYGWDGEEIPKVITKEVKK